MELRKRPYLLSAFIHSKFDKYQNLGIEMTQDIKWERYDDVLHAIYAAAIEPHKWPEALRQIANLWQVSKAILYSFTVPDGKVLFNIGHNISAQGLQAYATRTASQDPFVTIAYQRGLASEGTVTIGESHISREEILTTDFYREVWEPENIGQTCYAIIFDGTDSKKSPVVLSIMRSLDEPTFEELDRMMLKRMLNHLSRALGAMFHLRDAEFRVAASHAALNAMRAGVILLNHDLHISFENHAAASLLKGEDVIRVVHRNRDGISNRKLALAKEYQHLQSKFEQLLLSARWIDMRRDVTHFSEAFILNEAATGKPLCILHAAPLIVPENAVASEISGANVIVFVYHMSSVSVTPERLERLYDLTRGEAIAALEVLQGGTVAEMAGRIGVSENTFKTQLKAAYSKTCTHRQADFLKLLLALAAVEVS